MAKNFSSIGSAPGFDLFQEPVDGGFVSVNVAQNRWKQSRSVISTPEGVRPPLAIVARSELGVGPRVRPPLKSFSLAAADTALQIGSVRPPVHSAPHSSRSSARSLTVMHSPPDSAPTERQLAISAGDDALLTPALVSRAQALRTCAKATATARGAPPLEALWRDRQLRSLHTASASAAVQRQLASVVDGALGGTDRMAVDSNSAAAAGGTDAASTTASTLDQSVAFRLSSGGVNDLASVSVAESGLRRRLMAAETAAAAAAAAAKRDPSLDGESDDDVSSYQRTKAWLRRRSTTSSSAEIPHLDEGTTRPAHQHTGALIESTGGTACCTVPARAHRLPGYAKAGERNDAAWAAMATPFIASLRGGASFTVEPRVANVRAAARANRLQLNGRAERDVSGGIGTEEELSGRMVAAAAEGLDIVVGDVVEAKARSGAEGNVSKVLMTSAPPVKHPSRGVKVRAGVKGKGLKSRSPSRSVTPSGRQQSSPAALRPPSPSPYDRHGVLRRGGTPKAEPSETAARDAAAVASASAGVDGVATLRLRDGSLRLEDGSAPFGAPLPPAAAPAPSDALLPAAPSVDVDGAEVMRGDVGESNARVRLPRQRHPECAPVSTSWHGDRVQSVPGRPAPHPVEGLTAPSCPMGRPAFEHELSVAVDAVMLGGGSQGPRVMRSVSATDQNAAETRRQRGRVGGAGPDRVGAGPSEEGNTELLRKRRRAPEPQLSGGAESIPEYVLRQMERRARNRERLDGLMARQAAHRSRSPPSSPPHFDPLDSNGQQAGGVRGPEVGGSGGASLNGGKSSEGAGTSTPRRSDTGGVLQLVAAAPLSSFVVGSVADVEFRLTRGEDGVDGKKGSSNLPCGGVVRARVRVDVGKAPHENRVSRLAVRVKELEMEGCKWTQCDGFLQVQVGDHVIPPSADSEDVPVKLSESATKAGAQSVWGSGVIDSKHIGASSSATPPPQPHERLPVLDEGLGRDDAELRVVARLVWKAKRAESENSGVDPKDAAAEGGGVVGPVGGSRRSSVVPILRPTAGSESSAPARQSTSAAADATEAEINALLGIG